MYEKRKLELIEQTKAKTDALEGLQAALTVLLEQSKLLHEQRQRLRERERQLDASYESAMQRIRQLEVDLRLFSAQYAQSLVSKPNQP